MSEVMCITVPAKTKYISAVRLALSAACGDLDFNINKLDDLKSCISESCLLLMCGQNKNDVLIECEISRDIKVTITGNGGEYADKECNCNELNEEISKIMISSLSDECNIQECDGRIEKIAFIIKSGD